MLKNRVHFSSKDYDIFNKKDAMKSFAYYCQMKASILYHTLTIKEATTSLKCSKATLYRHLKVLKELGYVKIQDDKIVLKGQLTRNSYRYNRFALTNQPKRKKGQSVHMSVHIGKTVKETKTSLEGLKIVSNILSQERAIETRLKTASKVKKSCEKLIYRSHYGFNTLSNQRAAKITSYKCKETGRKRLRKLQELGYFKMRYAYIIISLNTESEHIKKDISMNHPALRTATFRKREYLIRQTGNQISSISHTHFGEPHFTFTREQYDSPVFFGTRRTRYVDHVYEGFHLLQGQ